MGPASPTGWAAGRLERARVVAERAVLEAEAIVTSRAGGWTSRVAKRANDFATDLDLDVEAAMRAILGDVDGEPIAVLGEEMGGDDPATVDACWVIDPIDGTTNVIRGIPTFTVTLALLVAGSPVVGVVSAPMLGQRFVAARGMGAHAVQGERRSTLRVSTLDAIGDALVGVNDLASVTDPEERAILEPRLGRLALEAFQVRCHGSIALEMAWVAAGRLDACLAFSNRPWDVQAGALLVEESGGRVVDRDGSSHGLGSRYTIASNAALVPALIDRLG